MAPAPDALSGTTTQRNLHKNIRFNPKMDEWSILARLADFEDEKKKEKERNVQKSKQQDVLNMLSQ
jgi:hypothetical protein